jgi:tetratricopeptide (TPR) repeat protein
MRAIALPCSSSSSPLVTSREPEADFNTRVRDTLGTILRRGHRIPLAGLNKDEVREFLSRGFEISLPEQSLSAVQAGTGGNPLFLDELARRFVAEGQLRELPGGGLQVPEGLKGPIRSRLTSLTAEARGLLSIASVIGREFPFDLLVAASGVARESVLATLSKLAALGLVDLAGFGLGPYRFAHALIRETIYQDLAVEERWRLHRRVGEAVETLYAHDLDKHLDHLAHHFRQSAALGDFDRAVDYSQQAGRRATRQFGYDEAISHYRQALELAQAAEYGGPSRFDLLLALGDAQWWAGHVTEAGETFRAAAFLARQMSDPHPLAEAALRVGEVGYGGAYMQAWSLDPLIVELLDEALAALTGEESLLKVRVLARLSTALYFSPFDSLTRRESLSRASVELARRLGDGQTLAYALNARHLAVWGPDNIEERLMLAAEIVELSADTGDVSLELTGRVWRLADLLEVGDVQAADQEIEAYEALARRVAYPHFVAYAFMFRAMRAMLRGEFANAQALADRSSALGERVGDVNVRLSNQVQMAVLRALQGRVQESATYLELVAREHPPELARLVSGGLLCLAGDPTAVPEAFYAIWRARDRIPPAFLLTMATAMAWLATNAGASQEAAAIYDLLSPYEPRWVLAGRDAVAPLGPVAFPLGKLAASLSRFDAAAGHFEVALEATEKVGSRPYLALTQGAYGTMLARRGAPLDCQRATQLLADALKTAKELGMNQLYEQVVAAQADLSEGAAPKERQLTEISSGSAIFQREGEYWTVGFEGVVVRMKDAKGLRYLRRLLADPGREFHVLDLAGEGTPSKIGTAADHVPEGYSLVGIDVEGILDPAAKSAYRARIEELRREVEIADDHNDLERASRARAELDFIVGELGSAVGLGGRDRRVSSVGERARSAVGKSLRGSLERIGKAHPTLGAHLAATISTGYFCSYKPDPRAPLEWKT